MSDWPSMRFVVIGLARAGTSMAAALAKLGAKVTVVDQKPADALSMIQAMDKLRAQDVEVITSWSGELNWQDVDVVAPSPGVLRNHPSIVEAQKRGIPVWSEVELGYRIANAPIVAITGTNGKSTVTALTHHILKSCDKDAFLCGNIAGTGLGENPICTAAMEAGNDAYLVAEVSSFQLEWIDWFKPFACTITNIAADHLDRYLSFEEYARTKHRIYENQTVFDFAILNLERPETFPRSGRARQLSYGREDAMILVGVDDLKLGEVVLRSSDLWARGRHNLQNAAAALLLAYACGVSAEDGANAIADFKGIANRMEFLGEEDGRKFINNSMCTNPSALRASLEATQPPVILLAGGVNKVRDENAFRGLPSAVRQAFLFGRDAGELSRALGQDGTPNKVVATLSDAFNEAVKISQSGDTILLSPGCASFDQFNDFIARGESFRGIVRDFMGGVKL